MMLKQVEGLVKFSTLWALWDCGVTNTAVWKVALLHVCTLARVQQGHATLQVAMFNAARVDTNIIVTSLPT